MSDVILKNEHRVIGAIKLSVCDIINENFLFNSKLDYEAGYVTFRQLIDVSRSNRFNYALFFAKPEQLMRLIEDRDKKIFGKFDKNYIVGTRGEKLDIRLIGHLILDFSGKQEVYKKYGYDARLDKIVKFLKKTPKTTEEQADYVLDILKIDMAMFRSKKSKSEAFRYLRGRLSSNHIHTYIEAQNCMPLNMPDNIELSGFLLRDNYNPIIFITNELSNHPEESAGRKNYTTLFLTVSLFKGFSYAVKIDNLSYDVDYRNFKTLSKIHDITNEILLPKYLLQDLSVKDYDELSLASSNLKVTPRCLLVRLSKLGLLDKDIYKILDAECYEKFQHFSRRYKETAIETGGGPGYKTMVRYFQGDFLDFIKRNIPASEQKEIFNKHVRYEKYRLTLNDFYD